MEDGKETEVINRIKEDEKNVEYFFLSFYSTHLQQNVSQLEKSLVSPSSSPITITLCSPSKRHPSLRGAGPQPRNNPCSSFIWTAQTAKEGWKGSGLLPDPSIRGSLGHWGLQPSHMWRDRHQLGGATPPGSCLPLLSCS